MKALMLAAGMGNRLSGRDETHRPKCLLRFDGRTLLDRHIANLRALGIEEMVMVVGYRSHEIEAEVAAVGAGDFVRFLSNPRYREGSVVSLWTGREVLESGDPVLFMDADVLYDAAILRRLALEPGLIESLGEGSLATRVPSQDEHLEAILETYREALERRREYDLQACDLDELEALESALEAAGFGAPEAEASFLEEAAVPPFSQPLLTASEVRR